MQEIDFAFSTTTEKDIAKAVIASGYVQPEMVSSLHTMIHGKEFQSICRLLITMSDRRGRDEKRLEDAYAKYPADIVQFVNRLYDEVFPKKDKVKN